MNTVKIQPVLAKATVALDRSAIRPDRLPDEAVILIALAPPIGAGLLLFGPPAMLIFAISLAAGLLSLLIIRIKQWPMTAGPLTAALVAAAGLGPGAELAWVVICTSGAAGAELLRRRFLPKARLQSGLIFYAAVLVIARSGVAAYRNPLDGSARQEPIRLWLDSFAKNATPIDPARLYVGNVPGPVFATSLLAIVISLTWFWYSRRLSAAVLVGLLAGAMIPISVFGWNPLFQLDSGPLWMFAGLILADRRLLPHSRLARPLMGLAAGMAAVAIREQNIAIAGGIAAIAFVQLAVALTEGTVWTIHNRRDVQAHLRQAVPRIRLRLSNRFRQAAAAGAQERNPEPGSGPAPI